MGEKTQLDGEAAGAARFRYYPYVMAAFVAILLLSNLIGAAKQAVVDVPLWGAVTFGAGVLFFPMSYIIGDVMTEVYGYAHARRIIWTGFFALLFMVFMAVVVVAIPPAPEWALASSEFQVLGRTVTAPNQAAYMSVFGQTPRIVLASLIAFWCGEFVNSFVLARMKLLTQGRMLWTRTIGSTVFGQAVDSALFYPLAFLGVAGWSTSRGDRAGDHAMGDQDFVGSAADAGHLPRGRLPQASRGSRGVRQRHRFLPFAKARRAQAGAPR